MKNYQKEFLHFVIENSILRFGEFTLKSGRVSPYFFNLGAIDDGMSFYDLGLAYARKIHDEEFVCDVLFGPAYKGIPIAVSTAIGLKEFGLNVSVAYNRKEAKDHGEGGRLIGAKLEGKVILIDDVLTSGKAVRESAELILEAGASIESVLIALDRKERAKSGKSAVEELEDELNVPVHSLASINDVIVYLQNQKNKDGNDLILGKMIEYQSEFCID